MMQPDPRLSRRAPASDAGLCWWRNRIVRRVPRMALLSTNRVALTTLVSVIMLTGACSDEGGITPATNAPAVQANGAGGPPREDMERNIPTSSTVAAIPQAEPVPVSAEWDEADKKVVRLAPRAFPRLPAQVRLALESRGCTIPQTYAGRAAHNVVVGELMAHGAADWAVLCSVDRVSRVLIFPGGQAESVIEWEPSDDRRWLQTIGNDAIGFSRFLSVVTPDAIRRYAKSDLPSPLDHDGLDEAFIEKGSTIHYCDHGHWVTIAGAD